MALPPRQAPARIWRWLLLAALLALLLPVYWITLRSLDARTSVDAPATARPAPALDRHTPRVN